MKKSILLFFLLFSSCLTGCVAQRQYRYLPGEQIPPRQKPLPAIEEHPGYKLAFIEFKDDGRPHDRKQAEQAAELIEKERKDTDGKWLPSSVVVIYIHGWKNNADQAPPGQAKNVELFNQSLAGIAKEVLPEMSGQKVPLIGVYIGWRGQSLAAPNLVNWVSFWDRSRAARGVGRRSLQDTLDQLIAKAHEGRDPSAGINPKVIMVGHSFGARVLEQAESGKTEEGNPRRSAQRGTCKALREGRPAKPPVDLLLYVNAATSSSYTRQMLKECQPANSDSTRSFIRHPEHDRSFCAQEQNKASRRCQPYPLFVSISSRSDLATRLLLPVASFRRSAAHTPNLNTHEIREQASGPDPNDATFTFNAKRDGPRHYVVTSKGSAQRTNPVWIMRVDRHIIRNHGDIWNEDFLDMLLSLIGQNEVMKLKNYPARFQSQPGR